MKVLAKIESGKFLCEVSDHELRKFMKTFGNFQMRVGENIDLTKGYDFASDAIEAMKKTNEFVSSNKTIIKTIIKGINIFGSDESKETPFINSRIEEIALKHCADYPNIKTETRAGRLYAIDSTLEGIALANKDLHKIIEALRIKNNMSEDDVFKLSEELKDAN